MSPCQSWHISAVEVKAFKSFSGASFARFDVSDGFVGVLGPNGSGKSNLLEAICFATGCSSSVLRGCRTLRDVTSTDAGSQLPEVKIEVSCGKGNRREQHLLETSLTPEGTRAYKIDGKIKTGAQVKEFLRSCGIVVDPTTVIQQASVTRLTDSNNPATLADLVSAASGLNSWNQETAAARQEILRTRKALKDIQVNITKVQSAAAEDEAAVQAALEASRLECELESTLERLVVAMQQQHTTFHQQEAAGQEQKQQLQAAINSHTEELHQTDSRKRQLLTQQAQSLAELDDRSTSKSASNLAGQIAAAESKVAVLQANAAAASNLSSNLVSCKQQLAQQESRVQQLVNVLQAKSKVAREARASLAAVDLASSAAESLQQQLLQLQKQAASAATAVLQQQAVVASCAEEVRQANSLVAAAEGRLHGLPAPQPTAAAAGVVDGQDPVTAASAAASAAAGAARAQGQTVASLQQHLLQLQMDLGLSESQLTDPQTQQLVATCGKQSSHDTSASNAVAAPLHACFRFRNAAADAQQAAAQQQLLVPLSVIAGTGVLQVLVAKSMRDANSLLAAAAAAAGGNSRGRGNNRTGSAGGKLKIWPLDNLRVYNNLAAQRAAQHQLGPEKVTIPLDLFEYDKQHEAAMIRAFGSYVIAADDATAAQLVQQFGLSSVTMQGTVSKKGSMSGGWVGSSGGYAKQYWANKLQHDATAAQVSAARGQLQQGLAKLQQLEDSIAQAEQQVAMLQQHKQVSEEILQLRTAAAAADARLQHEKQQPIDLQQRHADLQERVQRGQEAANGSISNGMKGGGQEAAAAAAAMKRQLKEDAAKAVAAVVAAQQQLDEARDQIEQLSAQVETLELQLSSLGSIEQQQEQLRQQQQHLLQLQQQQADHETTAVQLQEQLQQIQQQLIVADQALQQQQQQQKDLQQQMKLVTAEIAATAADFKQLKQDMKQLRKDFPDSDAVHMMTHSTAVGTTTNTAKAANNGPGVEGPPNPGAVAQAAESNTVLDPKQIQQQLKRARQLQRQIRELEVPDVPAAQKEICQRRVQQLQQFKDQMAALAAAADGLEARITSTAQQVNAANDAVFEDIASGFSQLCSSLLPALEVQLERTAEQAHEGLQFRFRRLEDAAAASSTSNDWQTSLSQLSGGQQTLVSLAMLLAVARAGISSKLFLLDEVDAALDEHNQARAAALLKQLANAADGGCQILCVTHNSAFQQVCDAYIQVVRGPHGGTKAAEAMGDGNTGTAAAAAAGPDQGNKKQKTTGAAAGNIASKGKGKAAAAATGNSRRGKAAGAPAAGIGGRRAKKVRFQM